MNLPDWPKHEASLHLTHNEHKSYYMTVEESVAAGDHGYVEWVSDEQKQKAIATNECWSLQWYPDTPVGFCILSACDLDVLLAAVSETNHQDNGTAVIENGAIVIRVAIDSLPDVVDGGVATRGIEPGLKVTDAAIFAVDLVHALNDEDEEGTTPIHRLFDRAVSEAANQGANGIEECDAEDED